MESFEQKIQIQNLATFFDCGKPMTINARWHLITGLATILEFDRMT